MFTEKAQAGPGHFLILMASMAALAPFAIDTYLPALPTMADAFGVDIVYMNVTVSIYLAGFAVGQLLGGPISDQIGRRRVGIAGLLIFCGASICIANATSVEQVQIWRAVQALGGGFAGVICMAMLRDRYSAEEAAKRIPKVMFVMLSAPLVAPAIGALLLDLGWPAIFLFLAAYAFLLLIVFGPLPETLPVPTGSIQIGRIAPQYLAVVTRRVNGKLTPLRYIFTQGFAASVVMAFLTNSAFIYLEYFSVGEKRFAFYFGANVVALMMSALITSRLIRRVPPFKLFRVGRRLQLAFVLALSALVVFGEATLWLFTPLLALAVGCGGLVGPSISGLYLAPFERLSGSAMSLINAATFVFGGALGALSGLFYDGSLQPIVLTMAVASLLANLIAETIDEPKGFIS